MNAFEKWILRQVDQDSLQSRHSVYAFALKMSFSAVILAFLLSLVALPIGYGSGLISIPLKEAIFIGVAFSWLLGGVISGTVALVTGHLIRELSLSRAEFRRLSRTDTLSGLLNRRAFGEALEATGTHAALAILDLDRFKAINDSYGHGAGDEMIRLVAAHLVAVFGKPHVVARLGGEEFGIILNDGTRAERIERLEELRRGIEAISLKVKGASIGATISVGVAEFREGVTSEAVYTAADRALYLAKALGRNRVVHESEGLGQVAQQMAQTGQSGPDERSPAIGLGA